MSKDIIVVGSGLAGMACASYLAKNNHSVTVIEKNSTYGGRLQSVSKNGYTFDSGPSWYWMPDIFDSFFAVIIRLPSTTLALLFVYNCHSLLPQPLSPYPVSKFQLSKFNDDPLNSSFQIFLFLLL